MALIKLNGITYHYSLREYLIHHNILDLFMEECRRSNETKHIIDECLDDRLPSSALNSIFTWRDTKNGDRFWRDHHRQIKNNRNALYAEYEVW